MEKFTKADRVIRTLLQEGHTEYAIYPFGEFGMLVKDILNKRYGIIEKYIIDNRLGMYSSNNIITLDEFVSRHYCIVSIRWCCIYGDSL